MMSGVETKQRRAVRARREQLLTLVNGWDPAGLLRAGAPRDTYDFIVDELLALLSTSPTKEQVTRFLEQGISDRLGAKPEGSAQFANRALVWFVTSEE